MSENPSPARPAGDPRVALVTGTSSGMGLHTAVELARRGLTVVATMRDTSSATSSRSTTSARSPSPSSSCRA